MSRSAHTSPVRRSPARASRQPTPGSRQLARTDRALSPEDLLSRVRELEKCQLDEEKERKRLELQRKKAMQNAKRHIAKEIQEATRLVRKSEMEVGKVTRTLSRVEQQKDQVHARRLRQVEQLEEEAVRVASKHQELEGSLQAKVADMGQARGRLAHAELAAKMLEMGVVLSDAPGAAAAAPPTELALAERDAALPPEPVVEEEEDALLMENARLASENQELRERLGRLEEAAAEGARRAPSLPPEPRPHVVEVARLGTPASSRPGSVAIPPRSTIGSGRPSMAVVQPPGVAVRTSTASAYTAGSFLLAPGPPGSSAPTPSSGGPSRLASAVMASPAQAQAGAHLQATPRSELLGTRSTLALEPVATTASPTVLVATVQRPGTATPVRRSLAAPPGAAGCAASPSIASFASDLKDRAPSTQSTYSTARALGDIWSPASSFQPAATANWSPQSSFRPIAATVSAVPRLSAREQPALWVTASGVR